MPLGAAQEISARVEPIVATKEHAILGSVVLDIAAQTSMSADDGEYVALAEAVPLVTGDRRLFAEYPGAVSMRDFLASGPSLHAPRGIYRAAPRATKAKAPRPSKVSLRR